MNIVELSKVCEVKKGTSITQSKVIKGNIPVIAGGKQPAYYHNQANRERNIITVSASGAYAGFINYFSQPIFASDCIAIRSLDENKLLTKYVFYILKSQQDRIYKLQIGSGQPHVYAKDLSLIKLSIPSIPIQKQIVSILERAEKLKEMREKANETTNEILKSVFLEMFGDFISKNNNCVKLSELCKFIDYRGKTPTKVESGIKLITAKNVRKGFIKEEPMEYITETEYEKWMTRGFPKEGDILFTTEAPLGNVARLRKFTKIALAQRIIDLQPIKNNINSYSLMYYLLSNQCQKKITSFTTGSTVSGVRAKELKLLQIPLPPINLQNKFALIVEKVNLMQEKQKQSTEEINQLFEALMQKAFKGELINN